MKQDKFLQMEEDAIKYEYEADFRKDSERLEEIWLEKLFDDTPIDFKNTEEIADPTFQNIVASIMKDIELAKIYIGISFSRAAEEAMRRGMVRDTAHTILREGLVALSKTTSQKELKKCIEQYSNRMRNVMKQLPLRQYSKDVKEACDIIHFNRYRKISAGSLAGELGVSASAFSKKFKRETGKTITDYILSVKMEEALRMQKGENYTLEEISDGLGFSNYAYFSRRYKEYFGKNPSEYIKLAK